MDSFQDVPYALPADGVGRFEKAFHALVRESGLFCGETYFPFVAQAICRLLNADVAIVGLLDGPERMRTLGAARRGFPLENFEYLLRGTPSHDVIVGGACLLPSGVQECFPEDLLLVELGIDGYAGVRLLDSNGHVLGVMAALFERPILDVAMAESVLQLFSTRTAVEIERSQMEASLRESSLRTRSLLEAMAEGMVVYDARGVAIDCNRAAERILRLSREEIVGLEDADPGWTHWREDGSPWPLAEQPPQRTLATGEPARDQVMGLRHPDGQDIWISLNTEPIRMPHKPGLSGCVSTFRDITERRRAESDRRRLEGELQHIQRLDSLGSLAGGLAHDMNNVLGAIMALATTLQTRTHGQEFLAQGLETIARATERGRDLVRGLLEFARKELEAPLLLDLNEIVRKEADLLQRTTLQRLSLELDLAPNLPAVQGDRQALVSALMNLCVNALDAMPRGGFLRLSTGLGPDGMVELAVEDTGFGMSPEIQARAFEPFFTTKALGKGTGLGLAIVYGTVKAHGGTVDLQSDMDHGTKVLIRLPAQNRCELPAPVSEVPVPAGGPKLHILVVDDDPLIRASVPALLETLGHVVEAVDSGEAALARVWNGSDPDLVLLDLNMPGLGGAETLRHLRVLSPDTPILLATGFLDSETKALVSQYECVWVLPKPFGLTDIRKVIAGLPLMVPTAS